MKYEKNWSNIGKFASKISTKCSLGIAIKQADEI